MDPLTFWSGILILLIPQVVTLVRDWRAHKANQPLTDAQARDVLGEAYGEALERLGKEYNRMLEAHRALQEEVNALRPLTLKIALSEQENKQIKKDKEDWKHYAQSLYQDIEKAGIVPPPFRRLPTNGDSHKMKAIRETADQIVEHLITPTDTILDKVRESQPDRTEVVEREQETIRKRNRTDPDRS